MGLKICKMATPTAIYIQFNPNSLANTIDPIFKSPTIPSLSLTFAISLDLSIFIIFNL